MVSGLKLCKKNAMKGTFALVSLLLFLYDL